MLKLKIKTKSKYGLVETAKVFFMIFLMISFPVTISIMLNSAFVKAQDSEAPEIDFGCCRGAEGYACQMTTKEKCTELVGHEPGLDEWAKGKTCEDSTAGTAEACKKVCCFSDGKCYSAAPNWLCNERGGQDVGSSDCSDVSMCKKGCCFLGPVRTAPTRPTTYAECQQLGESLGIEIIFDTSIESAECEVMGEAEEEGCCIATAPLCTWAKKSNCASSKFYGNIFCSDSSLSGSCDCEKTQDSFGCLKGSWDVHYIDSCGNPAGIKESCDYLATGERCLNGECSAVVCEFKLPDGTEFTGENALKDGESICVYDQMLSKLTDDPYLTPGTTLGKFGIDVVGSRHWVWYCDKGELKTEACRDYRQEICVGDKIQIGDDFVFREAVCIPNGYKTCFGITTREECIDSKKANMQCWWFSDDEKVNELTHYEECNGGITTCSAQSNTTCLSLTECNWNEDLDSCLSVSETDEISCWTQSKDLCKVIEGCEFNEGHLSIQDIPGFENNVDDNPDKNMPKCLPKYTPGYDQENYGPLCGLGSYPCFVTLTKRGILGKWKCEENCECRKSSWLKLMAKRCSALGDCGLKTNIKEQFTGGDKNSNIGNILSSSALTAVRYELEWDDENDDGEVDDDEVEEKDSVNLLIGANFQKIINEIKDYKIYSLEGEGQLNFASSQQNEFGDMIQFGMFAITGFIFGMPLAAAYGWPTEINGIIYENTNAAYWGATTETSWLGSLGPVAKYGGKVALVIGASIAAGKLTYIVARWMGLPPDLAESLAVGAGAGVGIVVAAKVGLTFGWFPGGWIIAGIALITAAIWYLFGAKRQKVEVYEFQCLPWQPPSGGAFCGECDKDPLRPCSDYRCWSLGAGCTLACGERNELGECIGGSCFHENPGDRTSPKISSVISLSGHTISQFSIGPPGGGAEISTATPFETVALNITTNEEAQCKWASVQTENFSAMGNNFIGKTLSNPTSYSKGHVLSIVLTQLTPQYSVYIRCKDRNGNENKNEEFKIVFSVTQTDFDPPGISLMNPENESFIVDTTKELNVTLIPDEPVMGCKWDTNSGLEYAKMKNKFDCTGFKCSSVLSFDSSVINYYYIKCNDTSENVNSEDMLYVLKPSQPLRITESAPDGTTESACDKITKIDITVETADGCCNGKAVCSYEKDGFFVEFDETGATSHKTEVELDPDITNYDYHILCLDAEKIAAAETTISFNSVKDVTAPGITRIYKSAGNYLKIHTDESSTCAWGDSPDFTIKWHTENQFTQGSGNLTHTTAWKDGKTWYVRCKDECSNGDGSKPDDPYTIITSTDLE